MKGTPTYYIWGTMKARCNPANATTRSRYAGRGIKVCKRWMKFENFLADMGVRPSDQHSLDRINNDGNYCKTNCRWVLPLVQSNNKSNTLIITLEGVSKPRMEWCRTLGITKSMLTYRLQNWTPEKVATTKGSVRLKATSEKPTALQLKTIEKLRSKGMFADWTDDPRVAAKWITDHLL